MKKGRLQQPRAQRPNDAPFAVTTLPDNLLPRGQSCVYIANERCASWRLPDVTRDWSAPFERTANGKRYRELKLFGWINPRKDLNEQNTALIDNEVISVLLTGFQRTKNR